MKKLLNLIVILVAILNNKVIAQEVIAKYQIDSSIKEKLRSIVLSENNIAATYIEVKAFENDTLTQDTIYKRNADFNLDHSPRIRGDSMYIKFHAFNNVAFYLGILNDSFLVDPFSLDELLFIETSDSLIQIIRSIPLKKSNLSLFKKPTFKERELIEGLLEINSVDYKILKSADNKKLRFELRVYFKFIIPNQKAYQLLQTQK